MPTSNTTKPPPTFSLFHTCPHFHTTRQQPPNPAGDTAGEPTGEPTGLNHHDDLSVVSTAV